MSKFLKVVAFCTAWLFLLSGIPYAETVDKTVSITVGGEIKGVMEWELKVRNVSDNAISSIFGFIGAPNATEAAPWVIADQYIDINVKGNYGEWGIYLITDNNNSDPASLGGNYAGMKPKILAWGPDKLWNTGDDILGYGGLIDTGTMDNPDNRALFAWRVEQAYLGDTVKPKIVDDNKDDKADPDEPTGSDRVNWTADWRYVVDKSNTGLDTSYVRKWLNDNGTPDDPKDDIYDYNYAYNTFGYANGKAHMSMKSDLSMPELKDDDSATYNPGDTRLDLALYLAARFYSLVPGDYGTKLFVRLAHE